MSDDKLVALSLKSLAQRFELAGLEGDPVRWIQNVLRESIWSKQIDICESVEEHRFTAVQASHGVGKSYIASRIVCWWLSTKPIDQAYVITTAPTAAQVEKILWREIRAAHTKARLRGYITAGGAPTWKLEDKTIVGEGSKPSDHNEHAFQGKHAKYLLVVVDEACGIAPLIWDGVVSVATGHTNRVLAIGNPTDPTAQFRNFCKEGSGWNVIRIDALQSPNICEEHIAALPPELELRLRMALREAGLEPSTEEVPEKVRENITSALWVAERARAWGTDSALWKSKVRGEFPDMSDMGVIPLPWVEQAIVRWEDWNSKGRPTNVGRTIVSADIARMGEDDTCIAVRAGDCIEDIYAFSHSTTMQTAEVLLNQREKPDKVTGETIRIPHWERTPHMMYVIDAIGVGAGVVDYLRYFFDDVQMNPYLPNVMDFVSSRSSTQGWDGVIFENQRAASWWGFRKLLDPTPSKLRPGPPTIMLPPNEQMIADLTTPKWEISRAGDPPKIKIELKEDIRRRLGRSPDIADAVIMAFVPTSLAMAPDTDEIDRPNDRRIALPKRRADSPEHQWDGGIEEVDLEEDDFFA